jgi:hypothetical protein
VGHPVILGAEILFEPFPVFSGFSDLIITGKTPIDPQVTICANLAYPVFITKASNHLILQKKSVVGVVNYRQGPVRTTSLFLAAISIPKPSFQDSGQHPAITILGASDAALAIAASNLNCISD